MRILRSWALVTFLGVSSVANLLAETSAHPVGANLIAVGFQALKAKDIALIEPLLMTEERYRQLSTELPAGLGGAHENEPSDSEIEELAREAMDTLSMSLGLVVNLFEELRFDLDAAQLKEIVVQAPKNATDIETRWIRYRPNDLRTRLDINYIIEAGGNVAVVKLNDVFLVGGERYLARGYRLQAYSPAATADESIMSLVMSHRLNGLVPVIEEEP